MISPQHDQSVPGADGSAHCAGELLVGAAHASRRLHVHVGLVRLREVEAEVAEVMNRVV